MAIRLGDFLSKWWLDFLWFDMHQKKVKINTFIANSDRIFGPEIEVNKFCYDCVIWQCQHIFLKYRHFGRKISSAFRHNKKNNFLRLYFYVIGYFSQFCTTEAIYNFHVDKYENIIGSELLLTCTMILSITRPFLKSKRHSSHRMKQNY